MSGNLVVLGPRTEWFGDQFADSVSRVAEVVRAEYKEFPDGEAYVRVPVDDASGKKVLVVQSLPDPQDRSIWQLLLMVDALKRLGAGKIGVYVPYLAYARQDRVFLRGEPVSVSVLLRSLGLVGAGAFFTIDVHNPASLSEFPGESANILAFKPIVEKVRERLKAKPLALAPDQGALHRAELVARLLGSEFDYLEKKRDRVTGEITVSPKNIGARGKSVIIVDDIISTGGTVARAASMLLEQGAEQVIVAVSHALMAGSAKEKLFKAGVESVISLNTLPPREGVEYVDATPEVLEHVYSFLK